MENRYKTQTKELFPGIRVFIVMGICTAIGVIGLVLCHKWYINNDKPKENLSDSLAYKIVMMGSNQWIRESINSEAKNHWNDSIWALIRNCDINDMSAELELKRTNVEIHGYKPLDPEYDKLLNQGNILLDQILSLSLRKDYLQTKLKK